jgi:hypothetical protein
LKLPYKHASEYTVISWKIPGGRRAVLQTLQLFADRVIIYANHAKMEKRNEKEQVWV